MRLIGGTPVHRINHAARINHVNRAGVTARHRVLQQRQALLLQIRWRGLGQQAGRMRARLTHQPMAVSQSSLRCPGRSDMRAA